MYCISEWCESRGCRRANILVLSLGGTIAMDVYCDVNCVSGNGCAIVEKMLAAVRNELGLNCVVLSHVGLSNVDSSDLGGRDWVLLGQVIRDNLDLYDGFLIIMGTNTLGYCSSALTYVLGKLSRPVVITAMSFS